MRRRFAGITFSLFFVENSSKVFSCDQKNYMPEARKVTYDYYMKK